MKKIIVLFCICYVCCNITSCLLENDTSKCENHKIEISGYSCFKFKKALDIEDPYYCNLFPEKAEEQKLMWRFSNGLIKESLSSSPSNSYIGMTLTKPEKSSYKKGEVVTLKNVTLTEEEKKIINNRNTCTYQFIGRYAENIRQYPGGYPNVTDPNLCFNVDSFNDLKGILNCGLANITYTINNITKKISTCFYSVGNKASKELQQFYTEMYFGELYVDGFSGFNSILLALETLSLVKYYGKNSKLKQNQLIKRKLADNKIQNYEIIVEDKNGKVTKYNKGSESIEVIKAGKPSNDDDNEDEDFDIFGDNSSFLRFNIFISLLLIILNL